MAVDVAVVHGRVAGLALAQSADIRAHLIANGVHDRRGHGALSPIRCPDWLGTVVAVTAADGTVTELRRGLSC